MRFIGTGGNALNWQIKFAGHNLTIIAIDGQDIEPLPVKEFNLHTGERYDAIMCANQEPGNYLINATYDIACELVNDGVGFGKNLQVPFIPLGPVDACMFYAFIKYKGHDEVPVNADPFVHGGLPVGTGGGKDAHFLGDEAGIHFDLNTNERGYMAVRNVEVIPEPEKADLELTVYGGVLGDSFNIQPGGHNSTDARGQFGFPVHAGWMSSPDTRPFTKSGRTYLSTRDKPREFWSSAGHWPSTPSLQTKGKCGTNGANIITVPEDVGVLEIMLVNLSPIGHAFHLHGHYFHVINYGFPDWCSEAKHNQCFFMPYSVAKIVAKNTIGGEAVLADPDYPNTGGPFYWGVKPDKTHPNYLKSLNLNAPLRKDMITLWRHQWATIRIRPDNPGHWLLHCHMEHHVISGMVAVLDVKSSLVPAIPLDEPSSGSCPVHGWTHRAVPVSMKATSMLEVWDWIVDYQRPTKEGGTWLSARISPNQMDPSVRSSYVLANGKFPGTPIMATEGDELAIKVVNRAFAENIGMHWHGQEVRGTPWADGTVDVSMGRIREDTNFTYLFTAGPAGTHLYMPGGDPLLGARGLKGALIVKPRVDTRAHMYAADLLMQISDAWNEPEACLVSAGEHGNPKCAPIDKATFDGMYGDGSKIYPYPSYTVEEGKCYRVRMIGLMSQVSNFKMSIAGHDLKLLAVDGTEVSETDFSSIKLHAGERYDFQLCANQRKGSYVISADASEFCEASYLERTGQPRPASCNFRAFLQYKNIFGKSRIPRGEGAKGTGGGAHPRTLETPSLDLSTWKGFSLIKPVEAGPLLKAEADAFYQLRLVRMDSGNVSLFTNDATPWKRPGTPLLMTKGLGCAEGVPIVHVPENATDIEVTIQNMFDETHVVHLHGMRFQVIAMTDRNAGRHLVRLSAPEAAVLKDTVALPALGTTTIRIMADNPGMWMLHDMAAISHLRGAAMVFNVKPSEQPPVPYYVPTQGQCSYIKGTVEPDFFV
jgi:iron transport multicopper oxidase